MQREAIDVRNPAGNQAHEDQAREQAHEFECGLPGDGLFRSGRIEIQLEQPGRTDGHFSEPFDAPRQRHDQADDEYRAGNGEDPFGGGRSGLAGGLRLTRGLRAAGGQRRNHPRYRSRRGYDCLDDIGHRIGMPLPGIEERPDHVGQVTADQANAGDRKPGGHE